MIEEHIVIVMDKSTHDEHLSQPLQTNNKQYKIAVTFLTGYNGIVKVTEKNNQVYLTRSINDEDFCVISIVPGAYEIESLNNEIKRVIIGDGYFTEATYPFTIKPNFSTLGSIVEMPSNIKSSQIVFTRNEGIRDLLGFKPKVIHEEYTLSDYPVDILSFDNFFLESNIAQGMIFRGKRNGITHNFTMDVDPGYIYIEKFHGGVQWYMMESEDIFSSISFRLKSKIIK